MSNLQYRQIIITAILIGVFLTIVRLLIDTNISNKQVSNFDFPPIVPLSGWQRLKSVSLDESIDSDAKTYEALLAGRKYIYQQNNQKLQIEMRYLVGTLGRIGTYMKSYTSIDIKPNPVPDRIVPKIERIGDKLPSLQRKQEGVGFYIMFIHQKRSHLVACINPRGGSTITQEQFFANRYRYDLKLERLLPWLLGKESLRDRRCLWSHLSLPLNQNSPESNYTLLEGAWFSWYEWWSQNFPPH